MYYRLADFEKDWKFESESTLKIFSSLTDNSLNQPILPGGRNIGRLAWHITTTVGEMLKKTGINLNCPDDDAPVPKKSEEIKCAYETASRSLIEEINKNWNDNSLQKEIEMHGEMWQNGKTLKALINHQIHHRAQITVLMRQAGLKIPGIYGPSEEEWLSMGMKPKQ
jgi:uncharacterized damage-inducible protein DinB